MSSYNSQNGNLEIKSKKSSLKLVERRLIEKPRKQIGASILLALALSACGDPHFEWKEQVKLQSGEVVVIDRTAKFSENWVVGGGGGSFNMGMTLKITDPASPQNPTTWNAKYVPIVLDRDPETGEWFIVATFFHCDSWYDLGRPKLPYTEYRYRNGQWVQRPLTPKWIGRDANVLSTDLAEKKGIEESKLLLTIERKAQLILRRPTASPEFRKVVGEWPPGGRC